MKSTLRNSEVETWRLPVKIKRFLKIPQKAEQNNSDKVCFP